MRRRILAAAVLAATFAGSGCARWVASYDLAPNGLTRTDDGFRQLLATGRADSALAQLAADRPGTPGDELLRLLYAGASAYYSGEYLYSAQLLDRAAAVADDRYTKSVSRGLLSLVSNDRVLSYEPGLTERVFIHYYGALNYLRLADPGEAAVEARRMSALLQRDDAERIDRPTRAFLRYFAGAVFEAAGEWTDAAVAYRNALLLDSSAVAALGGLPAHRDTLGSVLVVVERGFVAHRVEEALSILLAPEEVSILTGGDGDERLGVLGLVGARVANHLGSVSSHHGHGPGVEYIGLPAGYVPPQRKPHTCEASATATAATPTPTATPTSLEAPRKPAARSVSGVRPTAGGAQQAEETRGESVAPAERPAGGRSEGSAECDVDDEDTSPYLLRVAWPAFRRSTPHLPGAALVGGESDTLRAALVADLSSAIMQDFERELPLVIGRTIARATAKLAITKALEKEADKKSNGAGELVGLLGNVGGALLERADTRSWHLLPGGVSVIRITLPPGQHKLELVPEAAGSGNQPVILEGVPVRPGRLTVLSARLWR